ncbi:Uncharacterised protein [Mycolicibacterium vanbaalenii]|uniref:Uncharacterized protein n=1 Tax=Mycolicibacterium vanbaalenii TaxID=110539 RepID=A0A5S9R9B5_MYCVN|nr:Uncharacterised protein [Mycolicibacterium vanbaalenii]
MSIRRREIVIALSEISIFSFCILCLYSLDSFASTRRKEPHAPL